MTRLSESTCPAVAQVGVSLSAFLATIVLLVPRRTPIAFDSRNHCEARPRCG
jgi:hypothetical protein